ncbi:MAG: Rrf2 family transcriptional regulator [Gammaproteobacteria bacterium]|jgi:Rrf2 family iron-sulfur cluster assembly transcriptional regulator
MKLTTKGRYAVTAMLDVALHQAEGPVCLGDVARRQGISLPYLEQLFTRLRRGGLVTSTRGPGGGYHLHGDGGDITVAAIILAVDECWDATRCGGNRDCQDGQRCLTHGLWAELSDHIHSFLAGVTLADLAARPGVRQVAARQDGRSDEQPIVFVEPRAAEPVG